MPKLAELLANHPAYQIESPPVPVVQAPAGAVETFDIPSTAGKSTEEIIDEVGPEYLKACLAMAKKAMEGRVNVFQDGDAPHRMALLLAHRMIPGHKFNQKPIDKNPARVKEHARALRSIINSIAEDGEIIINTARPAPGSTHPAAGESERAQVQSSREISHV